MKDAMVKLAELLKSLSYEDMMYLANWASGWTIYDADGDPLCDGEDPLLGAQSMATNFADFADQHIEGRP